MSDKSDSVGNWPLWKPALREMRELPNFGYGLILDTTWFEERLGCSRETGDFAFQMLALRQEIESVDGYYLQQQTIQDEATGLSKEVQQIPCAVDHEVICKAFERKMRSYASRAVLLRLKTLNNPNAQLTSEQREKIEGESRIAATRIVLLNRERSIANFLRQHAPKMIDEKGKDEKKGNE